MSLLQHLRLYHGEWMPKRDQLNELFASRPPLPFTIYPTGDIITARLVIANSIIDDTFTLVPDTTHSIPLVDYYIEKYNYRIQNIFEYAIYFDTDPETFYPAELIFCHDIDSYTAYLTNRFTIVV